MNAIVNILFFLGFLMVCLFLVFVLGSFFPPNDKSKGSDWSCDD